MLWLVVVSYALAQNRMAEWQKSKHADKELPVNDAATWEVRKTDAAHLGRCHSEQGFKAWVTQLMKGDPSVLKKPDGGAADEAFVKSLGLTKDQVNPITVPKLEMLLLPRWPFPLECCSRNLLFLF